jgi:hypothetical protein
LPPKRRYSQICHISLQTAKEQLDQAIRGEE